MTFPSFEHCLPAGSLISIFLSNNSHALFQVVAEQCLLYSFWPSPLFNNSWGVFLFIITFLIPLIILVYCYGRILWILTRRIGSNLNNSCTYADKFQVARTNTIKTLLIVALCFIICWVNNEVYYLMYNLGYAADWNSMYYQFTVVMVFLNCTINPFIYIIKYKDYQTALRSCFGCKKAREGVESELKCSGGSSSGTSVNRF